MDPGPASASPSAQLVQDGEYHRRIGQYPRLVGLPVADDAAFVDDDHRPEAGPTFLVVKIVCLAGLALGMEVRQLRIGEAAQGRGPGPVRGYSIAAYAQNLGIFILELAMRLPERGSLSGSTRGEIEHVKR